MRLAAVLFLLVLPALPSYARVVHGDTWARQKFATAERMREALNGRPAADRTRRDYQRVIDAYRRVYYGSPTASKADPSVVAVAELQVEMGRRFNDGDILRSAVKQLEFLRREYPGSKDRFSALFTIGQIYKEDLNDPVKARGTFEEFIRRYPRNHLADDARAAIADLDAEAETAKRASAKREQEKTAKRARDSARQEAGKLNDSEPESGEGSKYARVTGVRHWSTPDYTRVAIDVEQDVKFESQRLERPERIFFDLQNTKLASTLMGKSFDVEDGFLKKIRVAQFKPGRTRIVLEVDDSSEYNAFLLPNPTRLIIDIHGKQSDKAVAKNEGISKAEIGTPAPDSETRIKSAKANTDVEEDDSADDPTADASPPKPKQAPGSRVEISKPPMKVGVDWQPIPRRIVEAEDDDDAPAVADREPTATPSSRSAKGARPSKAIAVQSHGKIKSADGNNDEVATLNPLDIKPEPKTPAGATVREDTTAETSRPVSTKASRSRSKRSSKPSPPELEVREAKPNASGDRSLIRALGLKIGRIVIDPGHGGHDTGTIGPNGLQEKDLVLDIAKRLGKLLETRLGANVVYTRQDDTFIPLETRTAIANQEQADLFVSIHANSSRDPDARGVETYYLNFTSNANALEVASRENAVSDKSIHELQDLVKKIALKEKIEESREFATNVQQSLHSGLAVKNPGIRDRGVKKAPFIVLIGANMPSILAEISFVSNPADERKLGTAAYRQRIAESLYKGISKYVSGLSGVKVASRMAKGEGQ
jgi:N-acetylmuramoyl-L-alanine amidase